MPVAAESPRELEFEEYLDRERDKDLLRFMTCGSVDDGKSTLIGRLLYDSRNVFEDQIHSVAKASRNRSGGDLDLSLLTDGLRAEREQGITIDVAYRYFATGRRKFIIADTPGHEQYTRNMATGASTADLAILLIDAQHGVVPQSKRHAYICALIGIPRYVVAINKMDLVDYDRCVFERIRDEFSIFLESLGIEQPYFLPISARIGDNVVASSGNMPWFHGPNLLEHLETAETRSNRSETAFRMAVQRVSRPDHSFRGYVGQVASGSIRRGEVVTALPSGLRSRVKRIVTFDGDLEEAFAPMAITIELEDQRDISRGDMLFAGAVSPDTARRFEAQLVWMDARPLDLGRRYLVKHTTQTTPAAVTLRHRINIHTLAKEPASSLEMNGIGVVEIATAKPLFFDVYEDNRATGGFIVIDSETNATSAAGMIRRPVAEQTPGPLTEASRIARWGHRGAVVEVQSLGTAQALERELFARGGAVAIAPGKPAAEILRNAGMLAILVAPESREHGIEVILGELEREGVLCARGLISEGGGI